MVEPQPSKRRCIHLIEQIFAQVSATISALILKNHRDKSNPCPIRAQWLMRIPSIPEGNRSATAHTFNLLPMTRKGDDMKKKNEFGSIRQLASGRYQVRYMIENQRITARTIDDKPLTFESYADARKYLVHLESDLARGVNPYAIKKKESFTLRDRVDMYLDPISGARLAAKPLRAPTIRGYRSLADGYLFRQIGDFCLADKEISKITREDIRKWYQLISSSCKSEKVEIKSRSHPARIWARSQGMIRSKQGRISPEIISAWISAGAPMIKSYRESGSGAVQVAKAYTLLKAIFSVALEDGLIDSNPCRIKGAGRTKHPERPTASIDEVAALAAEVPERYSLAVIMAAMTSLRSSELFGLQRKHINPLQKTITIEHQLTNYATDPEMFVDPKTDSSARTIFVPSELMSLIADHLDRFVIDPSPEALIFTTSNGLPIFRGRKSWFITARRRLDLDHLRFHDLRHTGQTLAHEQGANIKDLQRRAGQSTTAAAQIYLHGNKKRDQSVAESLSIHLTQIVGQVKEKRAS